MDQESVKKSKEDEKDFKQLQIHIRKSIETALGESHLDQINYGTVYQYLRDVIDQDHLTIESAGELSTDLEQTLRQNIKSPKDIIRLLGQIIQYTTQNRKTAHWITLYALIARLVDHIYSRQDQLEICLEDVIRAIPEISFVSDYLNKLKYFDILDEQMPPTVHSADYISGLSTPQQVDNAKEIAYLNGFEAGKRSVLRRLRTGRALDLD